MSLFTSPTGVDLYYEIHEPGSSVANPETIVFSHGLLWSGRMFAHQVAAFKNRYRVVTYDHRGQGQSSSPDSGYDMDTVFADGVALLEGLQLGPCHFAGLSMGGFVGMRLASRRPDLLRSLILLETSADPEPEENRTKYMLLNTVVRWFGIWAVVNPVMKIMFSRTFLRDPARIDERKQWKDELRTNRPTITKAVDGVISRKGVYGELAAISCPTLIIVGDEDVATPPAKAYRIHRQITGSLLMRIPKAGHSSSIEEPAAINAAIRQFLVGIGAAA
ncbi:alpha/beta fold hydrolase [Fibrella sp. HMF5335]|uniref:Alpha/beta fold hydrolase n=1 Tax=Fibrella rubiginis TaxID=2817060 RepID=A0A939GKA1_9BACT|nr:alpha/beta fold hydrolase [Fibrella rubiginis]MBO0938804.1 alpha/beta fold hydrolase [Fibrella rubiginis]